MAWSPDGSRIAVLGVDRVHLLDAVTGASVGVIDLPALGAATGLVWSTDGEWLILEERIELEGQSTGRLIGMHPDGTGLNTFYEGAVAWSFAWSSQVGGVIALTATNVPSDLPIKLNVVAIPIDGSPVRHLAEAGRCYCLGFIPGLTVSPDGAVIAMNVPGPGPNIPGQGLYLMNIDGSNVRHLGQAGDGDPLWQPLPATPNGTP